MKKLIAVAAVMALTSLASTAGAADRLMVKDATDATKFVVTDSGWMGIGDANVPSAIFHAKGATSYSSQLLMHREETNANGGAGFLAYHNNASSALPNSGDRLGYFLFGSWYKDGTGALFAKNGGGFSAKAEAAWSSTSAPTYFAFETAPVGATSRTEHFRITAAGNVVVANKGATATATPLSLTATGGFLYVPTTAGTLTSCGTAVGSSTVGQQYAGHAPVWFDATNNKICACNGTALKCTAAMN